MGSQSAIIVIGAIVDLAVVAWGASFAARRSVAVAVVTVFVAVLAAGCSW